MEEGVGMATVSLDWSQCPAVESISGKRSGASVSGERDRVSTVFENLQDMSVHGLVQEFGVSRNRFKRLQFVARSTEAKVTHP